MTNREAWDHLVQLARQDPDFLDAVALNPLEATRGFDLDDDDRERLVGYVARLTGIRTLVAQAKAAQNAVANADGRGLAEWTTEALQELGPAAANVLRLTRHREREELAVWGADKPWLEAFAKVRRRNACWAEAALSELRRRQVNLSEEVVIPLAELAASG